MIDFPPPQLQQFRRSHWEAAMGKSLGTFILERVGGGGGLGFGQGRTRPYLGKARGRRAARPGAGRRYGIEDVVRMFFPRQEAIGVPMNPNGEDMHMCSTRGLQQWMSFITVTTFEGPVRRVRTWLFDGSKQYILLGSLSAIVFKFATIDLRRYLSMQAGRCRWQWHAIFGHGMAPQPCFNVCRFCDVIVQYCSTIDH